MSKTIYGRSSVNLTVDSLTFLSITANDINATNASITNIEGTNLTYTNATVSTANVSTLNVSDINIDEISFGTANVSTLNSSQINSDNASITNSSITNIDGTNLTYTNGTFSTANVSTLNVSDINTDEISFGTANVSTLNASQINSDNASITTLSGTDLIYTNASINTSLNCCDIDAFRIQLSGSLESNGITNFGDLVQVGILEITGGTGLLDMNGKNISDAGIIEATTVNVSTLNSSDVNLDEINLTTANVSTANISTGNFSTINLDTLDLTTANVSTGNFSTGNISTLNTSSIFSTGQIQSNERFRSDQFVSRDITPIVIINSSNGSTTLNASSINCSFTTTMNTLQTNNANASTVNSSTGNFSTLNASSFALSSIDLTTANISTANVSTLNISGDTNSSGSFTIPQGENYSFGNCDLQDNGINLQVLGNGRNINLVGQNGSTARSTIYISGTITMTDARVVIRDDNLDMNNNDINNISNLNCSNLNTSNATITTIDSLSNINSSFNVSGFLNASSFSATRNATESTSYTADSIECKTNLELLSNALVSANSTRLTLGVNELNVSGGDLNMNGSDIVNCSEMNASIYYYPLQSISLSPKLHVGYHQGFTTKGISGTTSTLTWGRGFWLRQTSGSPLNISEFYTGPAQAWEPLIFDPSIPSAQVSGLGYRLTDLAYKGLWKIRASTNFINDSNNTRKVPAITIQNISDGGNVALPIDDSNTNISEFTKVISIDGQYSAGGNYARFTAGRMATLNCERVMYVDTNTNYVGLRSWMDNGGGGVLLFDDTQGFNSTEAQDFYISINFEYLGNYTLN